MEVAGVIARRSRCVRDQVGAVIVDPTNRVVATAYNGPPAGYPRSESCDQFCARAMDGPAMETLRTYEDCVALHAEANGLMVCDRTVRLGGTIYVTSAVCWSCAKLIANSGLKTVIVPLDTDETHAHREGDRSYDFLESCGVEVIYI